MTMGTTGHLLACTCPMHTREGHLERAGLDVHCPLHGQRERPHCPSCTCFEIVQTPQVAAKMRGKEK